MPSSAQIRFQKLDQLPGVIYRQQPGRKTFACQINHQNCFVKLHYGVGWREIFKNLLQGRLPILGAKTEAQAIQKLTALNIHTMSLLEWGEYGINPATRHSYLVTQALENTISLEDFCAPWQQHAPALSLKRRLIKQLAHIAQTLHANGVNHRDFYICHFLLDQNELQKNNIKLFLIDLHRAQIRAKTPLRWQIKDIAGLYFSAMRIGLTPRDCFYFMRLYQQHPNFRHINFEQFWRAVEKRAYALYQKTYYQIENTFSKKILAENDLSLAPWQAFIAQPDQCMAQGSIIKNDGTTTLAKINIDQKTVLIKRYNIKNIIKFFSRLLRKSRASNCWYMAEYLYQHNIATPRPLMMLEKRFAYVSYHSYFAMEFLEGEHLLDYLQKASLAEQKHVLAEACSIIQSLRKLNIVHGDMKATNWLLSNNKLYLLDLDAAKISYQTRKFTKDKQRFLKNWQAFPHLASWVAEQLK